MGIGEKIQKKQVDVTKRDAAISRITRNGGKIKQIGTTMYVTVPQEAGLRLWGAHDCLVNHFRARPSYIRKGDWNIVRNAIMDKEELAKA